MQIVDAGYVPICEKMFMYEMLVGCMMTADNAGVPQHIKQLEKDLEPIFLADKQIDEGTGERLAAWATERRETIQPPLPLLEEDIAVLLATLDVKTLPALKAAFEAAYKRANEARDKSARERIKAKYDELKVALEAQQI
jgi:hypothetical protein